MTLLSQLFGGGSAVIGDIKQVLTGNSRQTIQSNTAVDTGGGVWVRANATYQQSSFPELFAKIGYVNATIGITKTMTTAIGALTGSIGYSPDDDLYVMGMGSATLAISNSAMQTFVYKSMSPGYGPTYIAYGGDGGNQRFIIASSSGSGATIPFYPANQTFGTACTSNPGVFGVISANANTFLTWNNSGVRISTNSGAAWGPAAQPNTPIISDVVWGNVGSPNGTYIITGGYGAQAWVETSTDGINWSGIFSLEDYARSARHFALGTANIYIATFNSGNTQAGGNTYTSRVFTSTDARRWEYRGVLPYAPTSNNATSGGGVGRSYISAVGNGANTLIASTDWYHQSQQIVFNYAIFGGHTFGCHQWWNFDHGWDHHCGDHGIHQPATDYQHNLTDTKFNRIYSANATTTNTVSANLYGAFANAAPAHNANVIMAFGYGYANNATYYAYGTNAGWVGTSTDGLNFSDRGSVAGGNTIQAIIYGTANSTNTFMFLGTGGSIVTSQNLVTYTTRTTAYAKDTYGWGSGAFGNANGTLLYILGGNTGNVLISNDGVNFSGTNTTANIYGVAFGNSTFVAALPNGVAKYSKDSIYWSNTGSIVGAANDLYAVASDGVKFVYTAQGGRAGYLYDVTGTWTNCTITTANDHYGLTYGNNVWVMGGRSGSLFTSTDGITWTYRTSNTSNTILTTFYANNTYFYGGVNVIGTSTDAITWVARSANARISAFAYDNVANVYVYGAQGFYGRSTDGITWSQIYTGSRINSNISAANTTYTGQINDIIAANISGNIVLVAVGPGGFVETSNNGGNTWALQNSKTDSDFTSISYGNNRYLTVGSNGVVKISPNGVLWSGHASNANVFSIAYYQNNVNTFILVGAARYSNTMNANMAYTDFANSNANISFILETSNDGIYWTTRQWKTPLPPGYAVGGNTTAAIMDINHSSLQNPILPSPYNNSHNSSFRISVSNNIIDWTGVGISSTVGNTHKVAAASAARIPVISFANGRFFATSNNGIVASSNDGIYWTSTNVNTQFANPIYSTVPVGNFYKMRYHAATQTYILPHDNGAMLTSKDLVTWTMRPSGGFGTSNPVDTSGPLIAAVSGNYTVVYANNANNLVSSYYDATTEFYVPGFSTLGGVYTTSPQGWQVGPNYGALTLQTQTIGDNPELIWYVKAKT